MTTPLPRDSEPPKPNRPPDSTGSTNWWLVGHSSEHFGQRRPKSKSAISKAPWPTPPGFEVLSELGYGGIGVVYQARQIDRDRVVALKMILDAAYLDPNILTQFKNEVRAAATLQHPNIVQIYDVSELNGRPFLVLEYLDAGSLHRWIARTPPSPHQAASLLEPLARAVQHAHDHGIIHRDLKPSNILLASRDSPAAAGFSGAQSKASGASAAQFASLVPKIADFGLAKEVLSPDGETRTGVAIGTPQYMSPEQSYGLPGSVGPPTDVYALGAILYEMLTGRPPFEGATTPETLQMVRTHDPVSPRRLRPRTPKDLETICLKCLEKDPAQRYASAGDLADDLRRFLDGERIRAKPIGPLTRAGRWGRKQPGQATVAVIALAVIVLLAAVGSPAALWFSAQARRSHHDLTEVSQARDDGLDRLRETERNGADASTAAGLQADANDPARSLPWFANAVRQAHAAGDAQREMANRIRFRNWERGTCNPVHTFPALPPADGPARSWDFHPSGRWVMVAGSDRIHLWDVEQETEVPLGSPATSSAAWNPAGDLLAIGANGGVRLHGFPSGKFERVIQHPGTVVALAFDRSGKRLAVGNTSVRIWNFERDDFEPLTIPHPLPVEAMTFSPSGEYLATAAADGFARLFNLAETNPTPVCQVPWRVRTSSANASLLCPPQFADGGRLLVSIHPNQRQAVVYDAATGKERYAIPPTVDPAFPRAETVAVSRDGKWLAVGTSRGVVTVDAATGRTTQSPIDEATPTTAVAFSPDGSQLVCGGNNPSLRVRMRSGGPPLHRLPHECVATGVAVIGSGQAFAALLDDGSIRIWAAPQAANSLQRVTLPQLHPQTVVSSPDGRHFIAAGSPALGELPTATRVYDAETGQPAGPALDAKGGICHAALSPNRSLAALAVKGSGVQLWDWRNGKLVGSPIPTPGEARAVTFSPTLETLAAACASGQVVLINAKTNQIEKTLSASHLMQTSPESVRTAGVAFSPDGNAVVAWGLDDGLRAWDVATGGERFHVKQPDGRFTAAAFSPDGRFLATAHDSGPVTVWDWSTGEAVRPTTPTRQTERGRAVRFSPDGKLVLAALRDGTAKLWDWRTGQRACPPLPHPTEVVDAYFVEYPAWLVTVSADGATRVWDQRDGLPLTMPLASPPAHGTALMRNGQTLVAGCSDGVSVMHRIAEWIIPTDLPTSSNPADDKLGRMAQFLSGRDLRGATLAPADWQALAKRCREEGLRSGKQ